MEKNGEMGEENRQSFAYRDLTEIPPDVISVSARFVEALDLTNNKISDLKFLIEYPKLSTLVLDHNNIRSHVKMSEAPNLHTLWVNHNQIENLSVFTTTVAKNCPNLKILSMMNNPAAPSYFNNGTYQEYVDYRYNVISMLPKLETLDDKKIDANERAEAERIYRPLRRKKKKSKQPKPD